MGGAAATLGPLSDVSALSALRLFDGTDRAALEQVAVGFEELPFFAGDVLYRQGDPGSSFLLVTAGRLAVLRVDGLEEHELLEAGPGSVLGELSMLTGRHRMATVVARTDGLVLVGDDALFDRLVHLVPVHDRVAEVIARRVAELTAPVPVALADGTPVEVRPLLRSDRGTLDDLIQRQSDETLRRRFFSPGHPGPRVVDHLVEINYLDHFAWGVTADHGEAGVATARYVRLRDDPATAELAFGVADEFQGRGLGTLLLGALGWAAAEAGIDHFTAEVLVDNLPMRAVLAKAGGVPEVPSMGTVHVRLEVAGAKALLDRRAGEALRLAAREVVTAAGLALVEPG